MGTPINGSGRPITRTIELDLNESGFLCKMIVTTFEASKPMVDAQGRAIWPEWLFHLFKKLATANDSMMLEHQEPANAKIL